MDDNVSVINQAFIRLGDEMITSIDSPTSKRARLAVAIYKTVLHECLEKAHWRFAIKRVELSALSTAPEFEWDAAFQLPSDYVNIVDTYPRNLVYDIEGDQLLTNETSFAIRYVFKQEDVTKMPALFRRAWSLLLARHLCMSLTDSMKTLPDTLQGEYDAVIDEATYNNAILVPVQEGEQHDNDWELSRFI